MGCRAAFGGESGYSVILNETDSPNRKRFTVAHEIEHFVLHRRDIGDGIEDDVYYRSGLSNAIEAEANRFAADVLMPYSLIRELQDNGLSDIPDLASALSVSQAALKIRLGVPVAE